MKDASLQTLLSTYVEAMDHMRRMGVIRSTNNPTGDLAEYLFCLAFGWEMQANATKSYDALDGKMRIQIKSRRIHSHGNSRELSAIRDLDGFDALAIVIFGHSYDVLTAAIVRAKELRSKCRWSAHTHAFKFSATDKNLADLGAADVTAKLRAAISSALPL